MAQLGSMSCLGWLVLARLQLAPAHRAAATLVLRDPPYNKTMPHCLYISYFHAPVPTGNTFFFHITLSQFYTFLP